MNFLFHSKMTFLYQPPSHIKLLAFKSIQMQCELEVSETLKVPTISQQWVDTDSGSKLSQLSSHNWKDL